MIALWHEAELTRTWDDPADVIARKVARDDGMLLVAEDRGEIAGTVMVGYEGNRGWVNYLAVRSGSRRRGLGSALMKHAEALLRELGCPKVNLQVRTWNTEAQAFYTALGYRVDDVISMGRRLGQSSGKPQSSAITR